MTPMWHTLIANLAVAAVFFAVWASAQHQLQNWPRAVRYLFLGLFMGIGACSSTLLSVELHPGAFVDLRTTLLAVAGFFGGPIGAVAAGVLAAAYQAYVGGQAMFAGFTHIGLATVVGFVGYLLRAGRPPSRPSILLLAAAVAVTSVIGIAAIPNAFAEGDLFRLGPPVALLSLAATAVAGLLIIQAGKLAADRDLLRAALTQAPDF